MKRLMLLLGSATLLNACAGKDDKPPLAPVVDTGGSTSTTGGRAHSGGKSSTDVGGTGTAGGAGSLGGGSIVGGSSTTGGVTAQNGGASTAGATADLAPVIQITSPPKELLSPEEDGVIVDSTFDARCVVQQAASVGAYPISATSVKIELLDPTGNIIANQPTVPTQPTGTPNEYGARFTLTKETVQAGRIAFRCTASDQASPAHVSEATVRTYVDFGPDITFVLPREDNSAYPVNAVVPFEFTVVAHPLDTVDAKSAVKDVSFRVHTTTINATLNSQGHYVAQVDFTDPKLFAPGLPGDIASAVTATNVRTPKVATSMKPIHIVLDGTAPDVNFVDPSPKDLEVIGGTRQLCFTATDNAGGAGVNESTLTVKLDSTVYKYGEPVATSWTHAAGGAYCFQFNSTDFPNSQSQVTVAVSATDLAGNISKMETRLLYLDNVPPFVSLDPPMIRVVVRADATTTHCSIPFDPLGPLAADTASIQSASGLVRFRAFVWERTNRVEGQDILYHSGIDQSNVHLYMRAIPDVSKPTPVAVDRIPDSLGICDSVAEDLKSGSTIAQTQLDALTTSNQGSPDYTGPDFTTAPDVSGYGCVPYGASPEPLCGQKSSDLTFITYMNFASQKNSLQAVYAVHAQSDPASLTCTGSQWNISGAGAIPDGWVCVIAEAVDLVGNIGISAPMPICLDHTNGGTNGGTPPACALSSVAPPDCAAGCKPPSRGLEGDRDANGNYVPYDVGNPVPFFINYR